MTKKRKQPTTSAESSSSPLPEGEWAAVEECGGGEAPPEIALEREAPDEPDIDVYEPYQPGPDEPAWAPVEPEDASDESGAKDPGGKAQGPKKGRARRKPRASDVPKGRAQTPSPEPEEDSGGTAAALPPEADVAPAEPPSPARKRTRGTSSKGGSKPATRIVELAPMPRPTVEAPAPPGASSDAPAEQASPRPSMEDYIAELGGMSVPQLVKRHTEVIGKAPRIKNRTWLQRKLAWTEQTRRFGGLSNAAKKRLDELMGEIELPPPGPRAKEGKAAAPRGTDDLPLGTRLERKWRDRVLVATRVEGGWDCEGARYKTLSAAAKAVSGSHVSGPAFFGLWRPRKAGAR